MARLSQAVARTKSLSGSPMGGGGQEPTQLGHLLLLLLGHQQGAKSEVERRDKNQCSFGMAGSQAVALLYATRPAPSSLSRSFQLCGVPLCVLHGSMSEHHSTAESSGAHFLLSVTPIQASAGLV